MTNSKRIVAALMAINPEMRNQGFAKALAALSDSEHFYKLARSIIPDAYVITDEEVIIYEVADTHPIRDNKAEKLSELCDELDDIGLAMRVVVLDYTGATVADTPGWAYMPTYTGFFASEACMDLTPAAKAVMRDREAHAPSTLEELAAAVRKLPY
jgi:hypothetical protein